MRIPVAVCAAILLSALSATAQDRFPEAPGKAALTKVCMGCHPAEVAASKRHTHDEWEHTVVDMVNAGAIGTDDEFGAIVEYLATYFPKKVQVNKAPAAVLTSALNLTAKEGEAIVAYREKSGPLQAVEDFKKVEGLDYAKIESNKARLEF